MRSVFCFAAVLALAGCEADGRPSQMVGSALGAFAKGFSRSDAGSNTLALPMPPPAQPPLLTAPPPMQPQGAQAFWTGQSRQVQTVTGGMAWKCEYHYGGQDFVLMFENYCPPSASVR